MKVPFTVVIPARYAATRLPGKPLADIGGKPLIQHVWEPCRASAAERVLIATDDARIERIARAFGAEVIMTSSGHNSGTDRIGEVAGALGLADDAIVINVQGDEFGLVPGLVNQVAEALYAHPDRVMATLGGPFANPGEWVDPHVVKVIVDAHGDAIYFSRAPIPWQAADPPRLPPNVLRHMGLYAYRAGFLRTYTSLKPTALEQSERLEQLRALYYGYRIRVEEARAAACVGVDTPEDLERVRKLAAARPR